VTDQFTLQQIVNIAKQFRQLAPQGILSVKQLIEFLTKTASVSSTMEIVSENYTNAELPQFQQLAYLLDPFESGTLKLI
jgi:uncharacterized protein YegL